MINQDRQTKIFTVSCDQVGCTYEEQYNTNGDWHGMIAELKRDRWWIMKEDGGWSHTCPTCNTHQYKKGGGKKWKR